MYSVCTDILKCTGNCFRRLRTYGIVRRSDYVLVELVRTIDFVYCLLIGIVRAIGFVYCQLIGIVRAID